MTSKIKVINSQKKLKMLRGNTRMLKAEKQQKENEMGKDEMKEKMMKKMREGISKCCLI